MSNPLEEINATLDELMLQVFSGVDYVSKIALETGKSIPVVHRQLEELTKRGILLRERQGKRVAYAISWVSMAEMINGLLADDEMPAETKHGRQSRAELRQATQEFLSHPYVRELMHEFFASLRRSRSGKSRRPFRESVQQFLDVFGMLSPQEREALAAKIGASGRVRAFLDNCARQYQRRSRQDPRVALAERIRDQI